MSNQNTRNTMMDIGSSNSRDFKCTWCYRSNLKHTKDELKLCQTELKVFEDELKVSQSELKVSQSELKVSQSELKVFQDELKAFQDELKAFQDELKVFQDELKVFQDELNAYRCKMEIDEQGLHFSTQSLSKHAEAEAWMEANIKENSYLHLSEDIKKLMESPYLKLAEANDKTPQKKEEEPVELESMRKEVLEKKKKRFWPFRFFRKDST